MLSPDQIKVLKRKYGRADNESLAQELGLTVDVLVQAASDYALAKDKRSFKGNPMPRWKAEEVEQLKLLYPETANIEIARIMGRSEKSILAKAHRLNLKKTTERLSARSRENVRLRRDR